MKEIDQSFIIISLMLAWITGMVSAAPSWQKIFSFFPPYGIYLFIQKILMVQGWVV